MIGLARFGGRRLLFETRRRLFASCGEGTVTLAGGDELGEIDRQLAQAAPDSPLVEVLMAKKASLLAMNFQLYESLETLQKLRGPRQVAEIAALEKEINRIEEEMHQFAPGQHRDRQLLPQRMLPEGVKLKAQDDGQLGLYAARDFEEGEVVFQESPLAVEGEKGCLRCMKPLQDRRVVSQEGKWLQQFDAAQVEGILEQCGIPPLQLWENDSFCSDTCRQMGSIPTAQNVSGNETTRLMNRLSPKNRSRVLTYLSGAPAGLFSDEPASVSSSSSSSDAEEEAELWRAVRKNQMEASVSPMAVMMDPAQGMVPFLDQDTVFSGSALFLVASLVNHHCRAPNLAPVFLDGLIDTPFVATIDIASGEELFFDYAATAAHTSDKRIRNYLAHRFVCKC